VYAGLRERRQSEGLHRVTIRVLRHKGRGSTLSRLGNSSMRRVPNSAMRLEQQSAEKPAQVPVEVFECSSLRMEVLNAAERTWQLLGRLNVRLA